MKRSSHARHGSALILAIVVLTVVMSVLGALLKVQILRQKQLLHREWQLQAQCLGESAHQRAISRLKQDPSYSGENWQVEIPESSIRHAAAQITVQPGETAGAYEITVQARVPDDPQHRSQLTTTRTILLESR